MPCNIINLQLFIYRQFALAEIGIEDRMSRLTRVLRHQQQRMSNVTRAVLRVAEDNEAIAMTTSHYFSLINTQAKVIRDQNATIGKLTKIVCLHRVYGGLPNGVTFSTNLLFYDIHVIGGDPRRHH